MKSVSGTACLLLLALACAPWRSSPGGRCITEDRPFTDWYEPLSVARSLVSGTQFQQKYLGPDAKVEEVVFESDPRICRAISLKLGPIPPGPPLDSLPRPTYPDVIVVRFGNRGYYVQTRWHVGQSGEFTCYAIFMDRKFEQQTEFCG